MKLNRRNMLKLGICAATVALLPIRLKATPVPTNVHELYHAMNSLFDSRATSYEPGVVHESYLSGNLFRPLGQTEKDAVSSLWESALSKRAEGHTKLYWRVAPYVVQTEHGPRVRMRCAFS